ncbi:MAG: CDP-diacylglycerol--glycerol-3-phosphate 3-phosphatidyltransferase [Chthoniobacteraceae bacterium]
MNLPNRLTVARFFLTLLFVVVLSTHWPYSRTIALALFILASITDYADGQIARKWNMVTDFGKLMDPLVDKIMMAAAFICLVPLNMIPAWAVIVVISREFMITGLRLLAASKGTVLPAEKMGKHKTAWQIITVLFFLGVLMLREVAGVKFPRHHVESIGWVLIAIMLGFTVYSGFGYLWKNRKLIEGV